jgi:hypothetical protein
VVEHWVEIYGGLVAALFSGLGIWFGLKLTKRKETVVVREVEVPAPVSFVRDQTKVESLALDGWLGGPEAEVWLCSGPS